MKNCIARQKGQCNITKKRQMAETSTIFFGSNSFFATVFGSLKTADIARDHRNKERAVLNVLTSGAANLCLNNSGNAEETILSVSGTLLWASIGLR